MKILYFGAYDKNYSRNKINIEGLRQNDVEIIECIVSKNKFKSESKFSIILYILILPLSLLVRNISLLYKGYNLSKQNKPDMIIVGYPGHLDLVSAYVLKKIIKKPIVFDSLISIFDTFVSDRKLINNIYLSRLILIFEKNIYKLVDIILCDTSENKKYFDKTFGVGNKTKVLYIGAEDSIYKIDQINSAENFNVVFYGYASPLHGIEYIISAAKILENYTDIKFTIIGDGQTRKENIKQAKSLNLQNITFLPSQNEKEVVPHLQKANIFLGVFKNSDKAKRVIPNKVFQGLAMKKAVITSFTPAISEVFVNGVNILLCEGANAQDLANKIQFLYNNNNKIEEISNNAYKLFCERFAVKKTGQELKNILKQI
jgi:glycosyltransferase involved in cell wall biosynthesis